MHLFTADMLLLGYFLLFQSVNCLVKQYYYYCFNNTTYFIDIAAGVNTSQNNRDNSSSCITQVTSGSIVELHTHSRSVHVVLVFTFYIH